MPLGRVFEGHVNALRLVLRYGTPAQAASAAHDAQAGHLFAIWAAEDRMAPVRLTAGRLQGRKTFASGIGAVSRAVVTAQSDTAGAGGDAAEVMVLVDVAGRRGAAKPDLHGMRGAGTAPIDLSDLPAPQGSIIGAAGDYMRQPEISLGAWRTLAVLTGGLQSLIDALRATLHATRRAADPHQRPRLGACLVAQETARLWVNRSACLAEAAEAGEDAAAYIQLARTAVDDACATGVRLAQRSAGLAAQLRPHPIERLCRDLATYTRQPALDEVLGEAAAHFTRRPLP
jgi:alkylation response protein AidB-like acyl-CoA dehydrogenase